MRRDDAASPELDLIVTMDDATSTIYSAFLVEEEGTVSTFRGLLEVFTANGLPASLYTDRGSHYFYTPKAGEAVDKSKLTQVGRALDRLGIEHIAAYSPEARGRSERMFGTLQDRLAKELKLAGIYDIEAANRFIRLQLPASPLRAHYVKACVKVREYPDGTLAVFHGPRRIARYDAAGAELLVPTAGSVTPCSPPSRRGLVTGELVASASRRPALTAVARGVSAPARVGTWRNRGVTTAGTGWSPRNAKGARPCPRVTSMSASMCP